MTQNYDRELQDLLIEATPDGVMDWDLTLDIVRYSQRWKMLLGFEDAELSSTPSLWRELTHPDDLPNVVEALDEHLHQFWPFCNTFRMRHQNGEWRWILCRAVSARDESGKPRRLIGVFSDITDRVRAEERQRALVRAVPDFLLRLDARGIVLDQNPPDLPGTAQEVWPLVGAHLDQWQPAKAFCGRILTLLEAESPQQAVETFDGALDLPSGERLVEVRVVVTTEREALCILRDVTEQRRAQAEMLQTRKLESIGQLAAGIAHEMNTPLQFISDNLTFARDAFESYRKVLDVHENALQSAASGPLDAALATEVAAVYAQEDIAYLSEELPKALSGALEGAQRVARIVSAMKDFSHPQRGTMSSCDLNHEIETITVISTNVWRYAADLEKDLDPELPSLVCNVGEISQVVLNLVVNAAHAIEDANAACPDRKGIIRISTSQVDGLVEVRVADTGGGIPEGIRDRIFDPFFTTKAVGRGTGQGLAIARTTVVEKHGGTLSFETELGHGSTFIMRVPLHRATGR
jgi:PAS domain S-box-containing protein